MKTANILTHLFKQAFYHASMRTFQPDLTTLLSKDSHFRRTMLGVLRAQQCPTSCFFISGTFSGIDINGPLQNEITAQWV